MVDSKNSQSNYDCIYDIYQTVSDCMHWQAVLERLAGYVKNGKATLITKDNKLGHIDVLDASYTKTFGILNEYVDLYSGGLYLISNWSDIEWRHELGELCVFNNHLPLRELKKTEFYKQWLKPQKITGGVAVQIYKTEHFRVVLSVLHGEKDNSQALVELYAHLKILIPHLTQATTLWMTHSGFVDKSTYKGREDYLMNKYDLSRRELEVATALVRLSTIKKVADSLYISENTVKCHIKAVKIKMGLRTSHEMMLRLFSFVDDFDTTNTNST